MGIENVLIKSRKNRLDKEYLEKECSFLLDDIQKIRYIIEHIRTFSREQGVTRLEDVDVNKVIKDALLITKTQYKKLNIKLSVQLHENPGLTLGNSYKLEQVILNLLSNARDAVEQMHKTRLAGNREIIVSSYEKDNNVICIKVEDNGSGIEQDEMEKIFEPFYTSKPPDRGTGLGLSISYGIIKEMNGDIIVQSNPGEFTRFIVSLPKISGDKS